MWRFDVISDAHNPAILGMDVTFAMHQTPTGLRLDLVRADDKEAQAVVSTWRQHHLFVRQLDVLPRYCTKAAVHKFRREAVPYKANTVVVRPPARARFGHAGGATPLFTLIYFAFIIE